MVKNSSYLIPLRSQVFSKKEYKELMEIVIKEEMCDDLLSNDLPCEVPEQLFSIKITWPSDDQADYKLKLCPKGPCDREE